MKGEEGVVEGCDDGCSIDGALELSGLGTPSRGMAFGALRVALAHGGTFCQGALCISPQHPVMWKNGWGVPVI